jgi:hypothetical protein
LDRGQPFSVRILMAIFRPDFAIEFAELLPPA